MFHARVLQSKLRLKFVEARVNVFFAVSQDHLVRYLVVARRQTEIYVSINSQEEGGGGFNSVASNQTSPSFHIANVPIRLHYYIIPRNYAFAPISSITRNFNDCRTECLSSSLLPTCSLFYLLFHHSSYNQPTVSLSLFPPNQQHEPALCKSLNLRIICLVSLSTVVLALMARWWPNVLFLV